MSRNKLDQIVQNLYLEVNDRLDVNDKFELVREIINLMNKACAENHFPEQTVNMSESMVPYFGRHSAKQ